MPESKRARQEAIASLRDHRGWQFLCERLETSNRNETEALLNSDPSDVSAIAKVQGRIAARREVLRAVEHAHDKLQF